MQCPHTVSEDVYCVHEEDVVVSCEGDGDSSGTGSGHIEEYMGGKVPFIRALRVSCLDSPLSLKDLRASPGTTFLLSCPSGCR